MDTVMNRDEQVAKRAWEAWLESAKGDSALSGDLMGWDEFPQSVRDAWVASVHEVLKELVTDT